MMRCAFGSLVMILCLCATESLAGAWLRAEKTGFLSFGSKFTQTPDGKHVTEQDLYGEYGLRPKLTIGIAGTVTPGGEGLVSLDTKGEAHVFLRLPINKPDATAKIAFEFGLGASYEDETEGFAKLGLSWGRGISLAKRGGWINVDSAVTLPFETRPESFKLDATVGVSLTDQTQVMMQSFFETDRFGNSTTLSPGVTWAPKAGKTRYVVSLERRFGRGEYDGIKLGVWREF